MKQQIVSKTTLGDVQVEAEIIGQIGVHPYLPMPQSGCYTLTHVLSGYTVATCVNEMEAQLLAELLLPYDIDKTWNQYTSDDGSQTIQWSHAMLRLLHAFPGRVTEVTTEGESVYAQLQNGLELRLF